MDGSNISPKSSDIDPDILQSRNDVLRAKDIFPPFDKEPEKSDSQHVKGGFPVPDFENSDENPSKNETEDSEKVPEFNLGMQILQNQRQSASLMRKAPAPTRIPPKQQPEVVQKEVESDKEVTQTSQEADQSAHQNIESDNEIINEYYDDPIEEIFADDQQVQAEENFKISSHISNITKTKLNRTEESIIADIVQRDIEQFLKSA